MVNFGLILLLESCYLGLCVVVDFGLLHIFHHYMVVYCYFVPSIVETMERNWEALIKCLQTPEQEIPLQNTR